MVVANHIQTHTFKICVLGNSTASTSRMVSHVADRQFSAGYLDTIGVRIARTNHSIPFPHTHATQVKVSFVVWEMSVAPKFHTILPGYLKGASGAIVVGDLDSPDSLARIPEHIQTFQAVNPGGAIVVAWNKANWRTPPTLPFPAVTDFLVSAIYRISAPTGNNVAILFEFLARTLLSSRP